MHFYRQVYILDNSYSNEVTNRFWMPATVIVAGIFVVIMSFSSFAMWKKGENTFLFYLTIGMSFEALMVSNFVFYVASGIFKKCNRCLKSLNSEYSYSPLTRKGKKSLPRIQIRLGFYIAQKYNYLFSYYIWITRTLVFLLVAYF